MSLEDSPQDTGTCEYISRPDIEMCLWKFTLVSDVDGHLAIFCKHVESTEERLPLHNEENTGTPKGLAFKLTHL
jgi:hypothetical protein